MSVSSAVRVRVDFRPVAAQRLCESTGRVESISATLSAGLYVAATGELR